MDRRDEFEKDIGVSERTDIPSFDVAAPDGASGLNANVARDVNVNEEMATDFAVGNSVSYVSRDQSEDNVEVRESGGTALGWVALVFAVVSWFLWPVLMGATSAVLGFMAYRQGARALGGWAMAIGLIAVILSLVIVPFYYAVT
ncbi:MAG: hypothetical protein ACE3L7_25200 [Candidatus Pristimantibacillus sp.]